MKGGDMSAACAVLSWAGVDHRPSLSERRTDWPSTRYGPQLQDQSKFASVHEDGSLIKAMQTTTDTPVRVCRGGYERTGTGARDISLHPVR
jgi:hypothetical protein